MVSILGWNHPLIPTSVQRDIQVASPRFWQKFTSQTKATRVLDDLSGNSTPKTNHNNLLKIGLSACPKQTEMVHLPTSNHQNFRVLALAVGFRKAMVQHTLDLPPYPGPTSGKWRVFESIPRNSPSNIGTLKSPFHESTCIGGAGRSFRGCFRSKIRVMAEILPTHVLIYVYFFK